MFQSDPVHELAFPATSIINVIQSSSGADAIAKGCHILSMSLMRKNASIYEKQAGREIISNVSSQLDQTQLIHTLP